MAISVYGAHGDAPSGFPFLGNDGRLPVGPSCAGGGIAGKIPPDPPLLRGDSVPPFVKGDTGGFLIKPILPKPLAMTFFGLLQLNPY